MNTLVVLPILIPLFSASLSLLFFRSVTQQKWVGVLGCFLQLCAAVCLLCKVYENGMIVSQMGSWAAPFGITLAVDLLGASMLALTALLGFVAAVYSLNELDESTLNGYFFPVYQLLILGVSWSFITGDLFNLYVSFEILLIASFVLIIIGGKKNQLQAAFKYVALNLISSAIFVTALGLLYGLTGTLNMAQVAQKIAELPDKHVVNALAMMFLVAFGMKAAVFPLFNWLPDTYSTLPAGLGAFFSGILTKVGVYALIRIFTLIFNTQQGFTHQVLLTLGVITMVTGVLGAIVQNNSRKIISFHIISQVGYLIFGLSLMSPLALAGCVYFLIHIACVKANLLLIDGAVVNAGSGSAKLSDQGGTYQKSLFLSGLFLISALSLAGLPPLSGFWGKFSLVKAGLEQGHYLSTMAALAVSLVTLMSMTKIWNEVFWKPQSAETQNKTDLYQASLPRKNFLQKLGTALPMILLSAVIIAMGVAAGPVMDFADKAAVQLLNPNYYISKVMGPSS